MVVKDHNPTDRGRKSNLTVFCLKVQSLLCILQLYLIKQLCHCWLHISTLFHHAGKLYMKRLHSIYNTLVIKNILEKAFYFLLLRMFTQYLLLLLLQAVLYYFKKSSLSSGNYVCCLYSHLHQALVIETCSISQTKWHRTVSTYSRLNIKDN